MGPNAPEPKVVDLLSRLKRQLTRAAQAKGPGGGNWESVLLATAARYCPPVGDFTVTPPSGFDPDAAAVFEAIIESAFLVANADGDFDATEREVFALVVSEASNRYVSERQISAIVMDLETQLADDGFERRLERLACTVTRQSDRLEALRIAALLARVSAGVCDAEREVLGRLAALWDLPPDSVEDALCEVANALDA